MDKFTPAELGFILDSLNETFEKADQDLKKTKFDTEARQILVEKKFLADELIRKIELLTDQR